MINIGLVHELYLLLETIRTALFCSINICSVLAPKTRIPYRRCDNIVLL